MSDRIFHRIFDVLSEAMCMLLNGCTKSEMSKLARELADELDPEPEVIYTHAGVAVIER